MAAIRIELTEEEVERFDELEKFFGVNTRSDVVRKLINMDIILKEKK